MKIKSFAIAAVLLIAFLCFVPIAKAETSLQDQIKTILDQIAQLETQLKTLRAQQGTTTTWCHTFNANIGVGVKEGNPEISELKTVLQKEGLYIDTTTSSGGYDESLASAVTGFQEKYASEILTPNNLKHGTGFMGVATRKKLNSLYGCLKKQEDLNEKTCTQDSDCPQPTCSMQNTSTTGVNLIMCPTIKCVDKKCVKPEHQDCINLWWSDSSDRTCSAQKQFCGLYMYQGLKIFKTQQACLNQETCTPSWRCGWGECKNGYQSQIAVDSNNCGQPVSTANIACTTLAKECGSSD